MYVFLVLNQKANGDLPWKFPEQTKPAWSYKASFSLFGKANLTWVVSCFCLWKSYTNLNYFSRLIGGNHWPFLYLWRKFWYCSQSLCRIKSLLSHYIIWHLWASFWASVWVLPVCKLSFCCVHTELLLITALVIQRFYFCYFWTFGPDIYFFFSWS